MGLFDVFDTKYCSICGAKISLLGNRKLADGNLCKSCEERLSPWFSERKESTVEEISSQIEAREANRELAAEFHPTLSFGEYRKLLIDEDRMQFCVTSASSPSADNADIIDCSAVTGVSLDVDESKHEYSTRSSDGRNVEYESTPYTYSYDFYMVINVNHPYIDTIRFRLNRNSVDVEPEVSLTASTVRSGMQQSARPMGAQPGRPAPQQNARPMGTQGGPGLQGLRTGTPGGRPMGAQNNRPGMQSERPMGGRDGRPGAQNARPTGTQGGPGLQGLRTGTPGGRPMGAQNNRPGMQSERPMGGRDGRPGMQNERPMGMQGGRPMQQPAMQEETVYAVAKKVDPSTNSDYVRYTEMGDQIVTALTDYREKDREEEAVASVAVLCPHCGATTIPDAHSCCEYCGSALTES